MNKLLAFVSPIYIYFVFAHFPLHLQYRLWYNVSNHDGGTHLRFRPKGNAPRFCYMDNFFRRLFMNTVSLINTRSKDEYL